MALDCKEDLKTLLMLKVKRKIKSHDDNFGLLTDLVFLESQSGMALSFDDTWNTDQHSTFLVHSVRRSTHNISTQNHAHHHPK